MPGVVYHVRPASNDRFCKVGMTNGRSAQERIAELNDAKYAGFGDWSLISEVWVENASVVEKSLPRILDQYRVPFSLEVEVFVVPRVEVETHLEQYKTVTIEKYNDALSKNEALEKRIEDLKGKLVSLEAKLDQWTRERGTERGTLISLKNQNWNLTARIQDMEALHMNEKSELRKRIREVEKLYFNATHPEVMARLSEKETARNARLEREWLERRGENE